MKSSVRILVFGLLTFLAIASASAFARDKNGSDQVRMGGNITVESDEHVGDLVCIGGSITVRGSAGDVVAVGGSVNIEGEVRGDVVAVGGPVNLSDSANVRGDVAAVGGGVRRASGAVVKGDVTSGGHFWFGFLFIPPLIIFALFVALIVWLVTPNRRVRRVRAAQIQH